jgi:diadenylate cyclase
MFEWLASVKMLDPWTILVAVVDVAIVYYIIYRVLLLIRGTRAAYSLIGLLVVAGLFLASQRLQLNTLRWLLDNLINYVILIVIIVFQADIRRGLMRVGRRMFTPGRPSDDTSTIEEVVKACARMSKKRIGALIVFERDVDLSELLDPGTALQARVSEALLCNIFTPWPDNALHDGAVIVKRDLVQQAGAVLPLSKTRGLDKALGTRHRAGVGITEETDALAIVISEQRGTISLCVHGMLTLGLTPPVLRRELLAQLSIEEHRRSWLERLMQALEQRFGGTGEERKVQRTARPETARHKTEKPAK